MQSKEVGEIESDLAELKQLREEIEEINAVKGYGKGNMPWGSSSLHQVPKSWAPVWLAGCKAKYQVIDYSKEYLCIQITYYI